MTSHDMTSGYYTREFGKRWPISQLSHNNHDIILGCLESDDVFHHYDILIILVWHCKVSLVVVERVNEEILLRHLVVWKGLKGFMWKPHVLFGELEGLRRIKTNWNME